MNPKVKICCIRNAEEAALAIDRGADILGLVGPMPSGPGVISNNDIAEIAKLVPGHIWTFLLSSESSVDGIVRHWKAVQTSHIQLVRPLPIEVLAEIKRLIPEVSLVQVVHVVDTDSIARALSVEPYCDFILLDSGRPKAQNPTLGGTGNTHDWNISAEIVKKCTKPVFLAGGLSAHNIQQAIMEVNPYGLDLCSSLRTEDQLDELKLIQFFNKIR